MSTNFVVIHEAQADFTTATEIADRILLEQIDWLENGLLATQRCWIETEPLGSRLTWKSMKNLARKLRIQVRGHFDGEPGLPDAKAARRAIHVVRQLLDNVDAIVLIRDTDDQPDRRRGLEQARTEITSGFPIVIGTAICERESWVISGFVPKNERETERLNSEIRLLGWNPCSRPQDLTACKDDSAPKSPKRVLAALTASDWDRQRECWTDTPLDTLRANGERNGLKDYLDEVRGRLAPLIAGRDANPG